MFPGHMILVDMVISSPALEKLYWCTVFLYQHAKMKMKDKDENGSYFMSHSLQVRSG